jgi:AcrR family transcriptional regulator
VTENRLDRRRARTRAALLGAARELLIRRGPTEVSIQEITDAADVGFGSFYNHFESKQILFDQAIAEVAADHLRMLRAASIGLTDPAEVLAVSVRLTARFPVSHPELARVIDRAGLGYLPCVAPVAVRFLEHAKDVGRLCYDDAEIALACAGGATLGAIRFGLTAESDQVAESAAVSLLRMFGLVEGDARRVARRPLPVV